MATRLPFEDVRQMSGNPQYQGSQVQGSYIQAGQPLDVTGPAQQLGGIAKGFMDIFQASAGIYKQYKDVHRRTTLNEKQVEYNNLLKAGTGKFEKYLKLDGEARISTQNLKPENLEKTINKYVQPFNEFIDNDEVFKDDEELKSRASVIFQAKFFQAQGQMLEMAEKELSNRHLKHLYRHAESVSTEINLKSPEKAKEAINLFRNNTLKAAIDDGVMRPWQADAEVKKMWKQYNTVRFHADYQIAQQEQKLPQFIKNVNAGVYDTEYELFDGTKEKVGLDWNRIRGIHTQIASAVQGMETSEQIRYQSNLLKNEIEQDPETFLNTFAKKTKTGWDITQPNAQAFTDRGFQYEIKPSEQLALLKTAQQQFDADNKKSDGAVPVEEHQLETLYNQVADYWSDEALEQNSGNYDPLKEVILTNDDQKAVVAQIRDFGKLIGQHNERLEDASIDDIKEMETQILSHLNRTTDEGSKKYKKRILEKFNKDLQGRKVNLTETPAMTALQDILNKENPDDQAIFEGKAPLPVDQLLERQKELKIVPNNAKLPKIPEHLVEFYGGLHSHENISKSTVREIDALIQMQWGSSSEDIKRTYLQQLRNSPKGNEAEFGAYWELHSSLDPLASATSAEALRTKKEAFEGVPSVSDDIQEYISNKNTLLNVFNESNQIGAYRKLFKFLAQSEMLDSKIQPGDDFERKQIVKRVGDMLTKGWVASKDVELGSTVVARKGMFKNIVESSDLHEHLQHGVLVGKLGLNPQNITFPEYSFKEGTTDAQIKAFTHSALHSDLNVPGVGMVGITAVNHPKNADALMYALVLKKHNATAPQLLSPVMYNGEPLVYGASEVRDELIPAMHKLQFLEELFWFDTPGDVATNRYSVSELRGILEKGLPADAPPSKRIVLGQKWDVEDVGELEYNFIGDILDVAQEIAGDREITDQDLTLSMNYWNDRLGGFNARWSRFFGKTFDRSQLPKDFRRGKEFTGFKVLGF